MTKIIALDQARRNRRLQQQRAREQGEAVAEVARIHAAQAGRFHPAVYHGTHAAPTPIEVSIVVPTRRRAQLLSRCLAALVLQHYDRNRYEIIVVDDGPDDASREVVATWTAHCAQNGPEITYIPSMGPFGPAAARNHGWRAARGAIVAFVDDDTVARGDWLRNGLRAFADHVDAVGGRVVMPLAGTPTDHQLAAKRREQSEFLIANCFCRRRVLEDLGGFDERFTAAWHEDTDLHFRLLDYRAAIVHEPQAVVLHPARPAPWGISLSQVSRSQFDALLYKKHPHLYRRRVHTAPRWDFYLIVGAMLAAFGLALTEEFVVAAMFGVLWLTCTVRFFFQRLRRTSKSPLHVLEMAVTSILIPPLSVFWRMVGAIRFRTRLV